MNKKPDKKAQAKQETAEETSALQWRVPPRAGGPNRVQAVQRAAPPQKKSRLWQYLGPGIAMGGGIGLGIQDWIDILS